LFFKNLFSHDESKQAHEAIYGDQPQHKSSWTHEMIGGAAGFAGKIYIIFTLFQTTN
jgi:hypothetical protein